MHTNTSRGFTFLELMTVIGIIGILSTVVLTSLSGARERARDSERVTELKQIQVALEQYYDACGEYPSSLSTSASNGDCPSTSPTFNFGTIIGSTIPTLPGGTTPYSYSSGSGNMSYQLSVDLEQSSNPALDNDDACGDSDTFCLES